MTDWTTISLKPETRDVVREFRDEHGYRNYDVACRALLKDAGVIHAATEGSDD